MVIKLLHLHRRDVYKRQVYTQGFIVAYIILPNDTRTEIENSKITSKLPSTLAADETRVRLYFEISRTTL